MATDVRMISRDKMACKSNGRVTSMSQVKNVRPDIVSRDHCRIVQYFVKTLACPVDLNKWTIVLGKAKACNEKRGCMKGMN
jgi:hypothetical protein